MYIRSKGCHWAMVSLLLILTLRSPITHAGMAQTMPKQKAPAEVKNKLMIRWEGSQTPTVQMLKGKQSWIEGVKRLFQGGVWTFYADGKFVFTASPNSRSSLFPLTGTYTQNANEIQFQAEKQIDDVKVALDGSIRKQGKTATLETLYTVSGPFAQEVAQISQTLSPSSNTTTQTVIQGVPVPAIFDISLQGETDQQAFGPLVGTLQITAPSERDPNPFAVYLVTQPVKAIGSLQWSSFFPELQQAAYSIKVNQNEVQVEIKPPVKGGLPGAVWFTVTQGSLIPAMPIGAAGQQGMLRFKITGDRISGEVQATGKSDFLEQVSIYHAQFTGTQKAFAALSQPNLLQSRHVATKTLYWASSQATSFAGLWQTDIFGNIQLQQVGQKIQGTYTGRGGGTIIGTVQGNRLDFTWKDAQQGEGWGFFRMVAVGQTLAGNWGKGTDRTQSYSVLATRLDTPAPSITLTDKSALRDQAYDLVLKGKCNQAIQPLEAALALYKQERGHQKTWKLIRDGYLIDELNIVTRLAFCYHQLEDYEGLLQTLRYTHEVRTLLEQIEYLQGFTIPPSDPVKQALEQFFTDWQTRLASDFSKINFLEKGQPFFQTLIESFVELQQYDQALLVAEQGRARALVDLLAAKFDRATTNPPTLTEVQQIAKAQNATLVEYAVVSGHSQRDDRKGVNQKLYIWVIQADGKINFHQTDLSQSKISFAELVSASRTILGSRGYDAAGVEVVATPAALKRQQEKQTFHLRQLHQVLIEPIADRLPTNPNQRVIFIPQNELLLIPFAALLNVRGQPLIAEHTILTAPSIQVLDLTRQKAVAQKRQATWKKPLVALVVGNPTMPQIVTRAGNLPLQLPDLPGAKQEAMAIAKLLNTQAITGQQATETAIAQQMPHARFIHLATHGLLDDFKGLGTPGAVALAPAGNGQLNDGLLTADEILDMKLNAELVVLSACDTGRGRITGDGLIGLSRSLFVAGVPSVIVSLWQVPDESTAFLMTEFYRDWQNRKLDKAQALRQAMLKTRERYPHAINWAAFTLIGEAE